MNFEPAQNPENPLLAEPDLTTPLQISPLPKDAHKNIDFSLILPTYQESKNIPQIVALLTQLLNERMPGKYELIVVDDNSPDKTWEVAQSLMPVYPQLRVMRRQKERGLSTAVIRGWQAARGEILGVIDADLQHPPEVLLQMLDAMDNGADLVVASRHVEGGGVSDWSFIRRFLSRGAQTLGLIVLPGVIGRVSDPMSGYFMVRREAIAGKTMNPLGYKILIETIGRGNIGPIAEVGYVFQERQAGESKVTWKQYVEYLGHLVRLRLDLWHFDRFWRYGLVGFSGVFVDMVVFYLLGDPNTLGWNMDLSKMIAAESGIINNFLWNDAWTFADMSGHQRGWRKRFKRLLKFNLICLAGVVLNLLILNFVVKVLGINRYVGNLIAIGVVTFWNFWLNLKLNWRVTEVNNK
ncbi:MAG: glycosyltransferase [Oscillatoriaceae cyanobacterium]